jgi:hypothetical protein
MVDSFTLTAVDSFTLAALEELLDRLRVGRQFITFRETAHNHPPAYVLLRHDIDFSLEHGLTLAEWEADRGIRATYFLLLTNHRYNVLAPCWSGIPGALVRLGHEVGLHYDVAAIERLGADPERQLERQAAVLADLTGQPVRSIARHQPSLGGKDPFVQSRSLINAYAPRFTQDISYFSDSSGAWRDAAVRALSPGGTLPRRLQLLIHPMLWGEQPGDRWSRLNAHLESEHQRLERDVAQERANWARHSGVIEHDERSVAVRQKLET